MDELSLSQAELARRVGVKQQTIGQLLTGRSGGSRYLHLIARELGVTPAWLTGETDDPESALPDSPVLTFDEVSLLDALRELEQKDREAVIRIIRSLAASGQRPTLHDHRLEYRAA